MIFRPDQPDFSEFRHNPGRFRFDWQTDVPDTFWKPILRPAEFNMPDPVVP